MNVWREREKEKEKERKRVLCFYQDKFKNTMQSNEKRYQVKGKWRLFITLNHISLHPCFSNRQVGNDVRAVSRTVSNCVVMHITRVWSRVRFVEEYTAHTSTVSAWDLYREAALSLFHPCRGGRSITSKEGLMDDYNREKKRPRWRSMWNYSIYSPLVSISIEKRN